MSTLKLNHDIQFERKITTKKWNTQISINDSLPNKELATEIRNQIGLMGWTPYWEFRRDSTNFNFQIQHLNSGKLYNNLQANH